MERGFLTKSTFFDPVQELIQQVEARMRSQADDHHPELAAALQHLLSSGGKRIRVAITLLIGGMLKADPEKLVTLAASIELLHTATLVHDDLIDGSLLRRGIPTINAQWTPAATVLTGDFIFARAAKLAAETDSVDVMRLFAETLAIIVSGEIRQLFGRRLMTGRDDYQQRIYAKTASLFETAATSSAVLAGVADAERLCTRQYGYEIGMAFQIIDDVLDFTGEQATVGKPVGSDLRQGLLTLPALIYLDQYPDDAELGAWLGGRPAREINFDALLDRIRSTGCVDRAVVEAQAYAERAIQSLAEFPDCIEKQSLVDLARFTVTRSK